MTDTLDGLPKDGTRVRLILSYQQETWTSPSVFVWDGNRWIAEPSGHPLPGHLIIKGWERVDE